MTTEELTVGEGSLLRDGEAVATGTVQTADTIAAAMADAESGMTEVLSDFVENTVEYIQKDSDLLADGLQVPVQVRITGALGQHHPARIGQDQAHRLSLKLFTEPGQHRFGRPDQRCVQVLLTNVGQFDVVGRYGAALGS